MVQSGPHVHSPFNFHSQQQVFETYSEESGEIASQSSQEVEPQSPQLISIDSLSISSSPCTASRVDALSERSQSPPPEAAPAFAPPIKAASTVSPVMVSCLCSLSLLSKLKCLHCSIIYM